MKNLKNLGRSLNKKEQQAINGGKYAIQKCCIKVPGQENPPPCNSSPKCIGRPCGCS